MVTIRELRRQLAEIRKRAEEKSAPSIQVSVCWHNTPDHPDYNDGECDCGNGADTVIRVVRVGVDASKL